MGGKLNFTKKFIDVMAHFGAAYNLKTVSKETISSRKEKTIKVDSHWNNSKFWIKISECTVSVEGEITLD